MTVTVNAKKGDSNAKLVGKFKRKVLKSDLLNDLRDHQHHKKDSEIRKEIKSRFRRLKKQRGRRKKREWAKKGKY